jgi:hypothetical protein
VASRNPAVPASRNHIAGRDVDGHHGLRLRTARSAADPHWRAGCVAGAHQVFGERGPQVWVVFPVIQRIGARREVGVRPSVDVSRGAAAGDIRIWIDAQAIASNMSFPTLEHRSVRHVNGRAHRFLPVENRLAANGRGALTGARSGSWACRLRHSFCFCAAKTSCAPRYPPRYTGGPATAPLGHNSLTGRVRTRPGAGSSYFGSFFRT